MGKTGLQIIKPDVYLNHVIITYIELVPSGEFKEINKHLVEFNDEKMSIANLATGKTVYCNTPQAYLKLFKAVQNVIDINNSYNSLNALLSSTIGDLGMKEYVESKFTQTPENKNGNFISVENFAKLISAGKQKINTKNIKRGK